eukprot:scaffold11520_cov106-Amphora_coffeaeformis.AAC.6
MDLFFGRVIVVTAFSQVSDESNSDLTRKDIQQKLPFGFLAEDSSSATDLIFATANSTMRRGC